MMLDSAALYEKCHDRLKERSDARLDIALDQVEALRVEQLDEIETNHMTYRNIERRSPQA